MESGADGKQLLEPHLNGDGYKSVQYRANLSPKYFDFIRLHADGAVLLGLSNYTDRFWTGAGIVVNTIEDLKSHIALENYSQIPGTINLESCVTDGCFVSTSKKILLAEDSGGISVWSKSDSGDWGSQWSKQLEVEEHDGAVTAVQCLEPNHSYITVGEDANIKIWDISDLICIKTFRFNESIINDVSVRVDSTTVFATASFDGAVSLWDVKCDQRVKVVHGGACEARCVRWLDERRLVAGGEGGRLVLLDVRNEATPLASLTLPAPLHRLAVHHSSDRVAVCGDSPTVSVFAREPSDVLRSVYTDSAAHSDPVRGLAWDNAERHLLHTAAWDGKLFTHTIPNQ